MLDSVTLTAPEFAAAVPFYDAALGALGLVRINELVDEEEEEPALEAVGWGAPAGTSLLWVVSGSAATTGLHLRFRADSRVRVEAFHRQSVEAGGSSHSTPRRWPIYRRGEFNAIVRDPMGNLLEAVAPE